MDLGRLRTRGLSADGRAGGRGRRGRRSRFGRGGSRTRGRGRSLDSAIGGEEDDDEDIDSREVVVHGVRTFVPQRIRASKNMCVRVSFAKEKFVPISVRHDYLSVFTGDFDLEQYVIGLERNYSRGAKSFLHLQTVISLKINQKYIDVRNHVLLGMQAMGYSVSSLHLKKVHDLRTMFRYCSKDDARCLYSCKVDELHQYASFFIKISDIREPSILGSIHYHGRQTFQYVEKVLDEVQVRNMPAFAGFQLDHQVRVGWMKTLVDHVRDFLENDDVDVREKGHVFLYGKPGTGKTKAIRGLFTKEDGEHYDRLFHPRSGRFYLTGLRICHHEAIFFDEFTPAIHHELFHSLNPLLSGDSFTRDIKSSGVHGTLTWHKPVFFCSNVNIEEFDETFQSRVFAIHADVPIVDLIEEANSSLSPGQSEKSYPWRVSVPQPVRSYDQIYREYYLKYQLHYPHRTPSNYDEISVCPDDVEGDLVDTERSRVAYRVRRSAGISCNESIAGPSRLRAEGLAGGNGHGAGSSRELETAPVGALDVGSLSDIMSQVSIQIVGGSRAVSSGEAIVMTETHEKRREKTRRKDNGGSGTGRKHHVVDRQRSVSRHRSRVYRRSKSRRRSGSRVRSYSRHRSHSRRRSLSSRRSYTRHRSYSPRRSHKKRKTRSRSKTVKTHRSRSHHGDRRHQTKKESRKKKQVTPSPTSSSSSGSSDRGSSDRSVSEGDQSSVVSRRSRSGSKRKHVGSKDSNVGSIKRRSLSPSLVQRSKSLSYSKGSTKVGHSKGKGKKVVGPFISQNSGSREAVKGQPASTNAVGVVLPRETGSSCTKLVRERSSLTGGPP